MIIQGMLGLGDNVYQRAFIKNLKKPVYLHTCWWQFYQDIPGVELIKPNTRLRTQNKNANKAPEGVWTQKKPHITPYNTHRVFYTGNGILNGMQSCLKIKPDFIDLPDFGEPVVQEKYALIRPVTIRKEWQNEARAPLPIYIAETMEILRNQGYTVVSVADLEDGKEWLIGDYPKADITFHKGELSLEQLMAITAGASLIVGGVGWIVPVGVAYNVPTWIIGGGHGAFNHPDLLLPKHQDHKVSFVLPDKYCRCREHYHKCNKVITNHGEKFTNWLRG